MSVAALLALASDVLGGQQAPSFRVEETTVARIHDAVRARRVTVHQLIQQYLDRIEAYDRRGPRINSLITVNRDALRAADSLDAVFTRTGRLVGPLHGIPVIVKDNIDTRDLPTTAGSLALADSRPPDIAANLGTVGLGTDTGNSIRGPASHLSLVGLRPTLGLVSRDGVVPLDPERDVTGPMTRTVADAAAVLSVIAGDDPADPMTARGRGHIPASGYTPHLRGDALRGARIGVLRQLSNTPTTDPEVLRRFEDALHVMHTRGAVLVDSVVIPGATELAQRLPRECRAFRQALSDYLMTLHTKAPVHSLQEIIASGKLHPSLEARFQMYQDAKPPEDNAACRVADSQVKQLRSRVERLLTEGRLDVLVYPSWNNPPRPLGDLNSPHGRNGPRIASVVGFPAITVPMGFVRDATLPVGLEILGDDWSEPRLIEIAYAYEQATHHRKPAVSTPAIRRNSRR